MLRVATFNIRHGRPPGARTSDPHALAAAVASLDADVLALQEVDVGAARSGRLDLAAVATGAGPGRVGHFAPARPLQGGWYGNALVVRGAVDEVADVPLPGVGEPRVLTVARVTVGSATVTVAATHLQHRGRTPVHEAPAQLEVVLDRVAAARADGSPVVVLGDLNLGPDRVLPAAGRVGLVAVDAPPTFPADRPRRRIDWVLVGGAEVAAVAVPDLRTSDHRPLVVDLILP